MPHKDGETFRGELAQVRRRVVRHLFLSDGERYLYSRLTQDLVRPHVARHDHPVRVVGLIVRNDLYTRTVWAHGPDGGILQDVCAAGAGQGDMHGIGLPGVHKAGLRLIDRALGAGEAELRPAIHQLLWIQKLVVEAVFFKGRDVAVDVSGADLLRIAPFRVLDDQATGLEYHLYARLAFDLVESFVGVRGQGRVLRLVLGQTDDPGVVLRRAALVTQSELLDAEHGSPDLPREPVQCGRPEPAAADDYHLMVVQSDTPSQPGPSRQPVRMLVSPAGVCLIWICSGSWRSTPPRTVTSSRPFSKLALTLFASMFSGSFNLRLKWP